MILKGRDSYFKVPGVETIPTNANLEARPRTLPEVPLMRKTEESMSKALFEIIDAVKCSEAFEARPRRKHLSPKAAPVVKDVLEGETRDRKHLAPVYELVYYEEDNGEDVFRLSYDQELKKLIARKVMHPILAPDRFVSPVHRTRR